MMTGKGSEGAGQLNNTECCMCGDLGFSDQLFQCKVCQFRSQHRYCSNLYPKDESYAGTCNWCLSQKDQDAKEKSPNSSNSSSSHHKNNNGITHHEDTKNKRIIRKGLRGNSNSNGSGGLQPIKKPKSPEARSSPKSSSPSPTPTPTPSPSVVTSTRKRIVTNGALEERLRRTKSEDIANRRSGAAAATATRQVVFRNKVRRYKLLDEVSS